MHRIIFYSWQSDSPNGTNRGFIEKALNNAAQTITGDKAIQFEASVDRDTAGMTGSPDIPNAIFSKIDKADIFVADVTIVNPQAIGRKTPNPNVLIELGYAIHALGFEKILLVFNSAYGTIEELPFDLRQKRIMSYKALPGEADRSACRIALEKQMEQAIRLSFLQHNSDPKVTQSAAFLAIENVSLKRHILVKAELADILAELIKIEPPKLADRGTIEDLYLALDQTVPYYLQFARLTELAVLLNDEAVLKVIYQWFGGLFERTNRLADYTGGITDGDFDFFRFLSHEFMVTFAGFLLNAECLELLVTFLKTPITINYLREEYGPGEVYYYFAAQWTHLLWEQNEKLQKYSAHGYLLKQRHHREDVMEVFPFKDFMTADYFLFLYDQLIPHPNQDRYRWMDWSAPSLNETPIFLKRLERIDAANEFIRLLNLQSIEELRQHVKEITLKLSEKFGHGRIDLFLRSFEFTKIGTKK